MKIELTNFSKRHFDENFEGTRILDYTEDEFINTIDPDNGKLIDGYAPFCKLLFIKNFTNAKSGTLPLTLETLPYLRTGYSARTEKELPVLSRWLEIPKQFVPSAEYLCIVLYSRDQCLKESQSTGEEFELQDDTDYGIVSIMAQVTDSEEPMNPITMMRNSLGMEEGGSGVPLDRDKYKESVEFWSNNAIVRY